MTKKENAAGAAENVALPDFGGGTAQKQRHPGAVVDFNSGRTGGNAVAAAPFRKTIRMARNRGIGKESGYGAE